MTIKRLTAIILSAIMLVSLFGCTAKSEIEEETTSTETTAARPEKMPDFKVYTMDGREITLYESFGKPLVVNFWATWCPPCKAEMPHFDELYKEYGDRVNFMMVNMTDGQRDTVAAVKSFIEDNGYSFPVYCDSDLSAAYAYSVSSIPLTLFFDAEGNILNYKSGTMSKIELEGMLLRMTGGRK